MVKFSELKKKIKKKYYFVVGLGREDVQPIKKMCSDICLKDETFAFKIKPSKYKNSDFLLFVNDVESVDAGHRKATWIVKKHEENTGRKLLYKVYGGEENERKTS